MSLEALRQLSASVLRESSFSSHQISAPQKSIEIIDPYYTEIKAQNEAEEEEKQKEEQKKDPSGTNIKSIQRRRKIPMFPPEVEFYLRTQILEVFQQPQENLVTTSEYKKKVKNEIAKLEETKLYEEKAGAEQIKEAKVEALRKFMVMNYQAEIKDYKQAVQQQWAQKAQIQQKQGQGQEQEQNEVTVAQFQIQPSQMGAQMAQDQAGIWMEQPQEETGFAFQAQEEEIGEFGDAAAPAWEAQSYTYLDQNVAVITDAKERLESPYDKSKMFNVYVQVKPKDLSKVYQIKPQAKERPKMYNVSVGVGPKRYNVGVGVEERRRGQSWDLEESRRLERIRLKGKRIDDMTLARPRGYKELPLFGPAEGGIRLGASTQVNEYDIEKAMAALRGKRLKEGNILWPMNGDFTPQLGKRKIEDFIHMCWKLDQEWMFHVRFIQSHCTNYRKKFIFEAVFCIPTKEAPVPPATASVFFVFEIGHYDGLDDPIKVHYCFEGSRFAHKPGHLPFTQKWLYDIIAAKLRVQRTAIDF